MNYVITITNTHKQKTYRKPFVISPTIYNAISEGEYLSDARTLDNGAVQIPLYKRYEYITLPPNSMYTFETGDPDELEYYKSLSLNGVSVTIPDEPGPGPEPQIDWEAMVAGVLWDNLDTLIIPEGLSVNDLPDVDSYAYSTSALAKIKSVRKLVIPTTFVDIDLHFQHMDNLEEVIILPGPIAIDYGAFAGKPYLRSITIPDTVVWFAETCFAYCPSLLEITIPSAVQGYGPDLFIESNSLQILRFKSSTPIELDEKPFNGLTTSCKIYVPEGSLEAYTSSANYPDSSIYEYVEY